MRLLVGQYTAVVQSVLLSVSPCMQMQTSMECSSGTAAAAEQVVELMAVAAVGGGAAADERL